MFTRLLRVLLNVAGAGVGEELSEVSVRFFALDGVCVVEIVSCRPASPSKLSVDGSAVVRALIQKVMLVRSTIKGSLLDELFFSHLGSWRNNSSTC